MEHLMLDMFDMYSVVLRFSHIGDVLLLSGVLSDRYEKYDEQFIIITLKGMGEIFEYNPAVLHIEEFSKEELSGKNLIMNAKRMAEKYQIPLYDMHDNLRSKVFKFFWKSDVHTYDKHSFDRRLFLFSRHKIRPDTLDNHTVDRYAKVFTPSLDDNFIRADRKSVFPKIFLQEEEIDFAKKFYAERNPQNKPIIALHPFASHRGKVWDMENWKELYLKLCLNYFPIVIGIGDSFEGLSEEHNALNIFSLRESASLINEADFLISGDSAPLHLANAFQLIVSSSPFRCPVIT